MRIVITAQTKHPIPTGIFPFAQLSQLFYKLLPPSRHQTSGIVLALNHFLAEEILDLTLGTLWTIRGMDNIFTFREAIYPSNRARNCLSRISRAH